MSVGSFISRKLSLRQGANGNRLAPSIIVAIGGIALSFFVMMVSIAVVTGFKNEIARKIMGFDAQVTMTPLGVYYGEPDAKATLSDEVSQIVSEALDKAGVADSVELYSTFSQTGLLKTDDDFMGVAFQCFDDGYKWEFEKGNLREGILPTIENPRGITISEEMSRKLHLSVGDRVNAYFFTGAHVRPRKFEVIGIYCSDFGDYDNLVAYAPREALAGMAGYKSADEGVAIKIRGLRDAKKIENVAQQLQGEFNRAFAMKELEHNYVVSTVYTTGAMYFNWLAMLDTNIVVILVLMGCVSGFMLIACVLILILERVRMVGMLKAIGATNGLIKGVFIRLGVRVVGVGLLIGNCVGWLFVLVQGVWHLLPLDPESYYLSYVPVEMPLTYWLILNVGVGVLSLALMLVPTSVISRLSIVKVLRFE